MRRAEEILESQKSSGRPAEKLAIVLERSGAGTLHPPEVIREIARCELDLAAPDIACLTFGSPVRRT